MGEILPESHTQALLQEGASGSFWGEVSVLHSVADEK